jgi:putative two-component system response regulator
MTKEQKIIIIVDDNDTNLTACKNILRPYYTVYPAPSAEKMFDILDHIMPDMILLDVEMPETNGYNAARMLKNSDAFRRIPIIFLTARNDAISEMEGLNLGALDYIHKPFVSALLLRRLEIHLSLLDYQKLLENRNKSKDELLSRMNNEIRTKLKIIEETLNIAMESDNAGKIKDCLGKASNESKNLLALVNDTFDSEKQ